MVENRSDGLLVRAEPLQWAKEISQRMVDVVHLEVSALLLEVDPKWTGPIKEVLAKRSVRVKVIRRETTAERLIV